MTPQEKLSNTFKEIWATNAWGAVKTVLPGSSIECTEQYRKLLSKLIARLGIKVIIDMGCGIPLYMTKVPELASGECAYVGIDAVLDSIVTDEHLIEFPPHFVLMEGTYAGIASQNPDTELCLFKDVLMHLTAEELDYTLESAKKFRYILITEDIAHPLEIDRKTGGFAPGDYYAKILADYDPVETFALTDTKPRPKEAVLFVAKASPEELAQRRESLSVQNFVSGQLQ